MQEILLYVSENSKMYVRNVQNVRNVLTNYTLKQFCHVVLNGDGTIFIKIKPNEKNIIFF